uniref:Uncharacterized protein n=1 Tax=Arundo donax TaxID=35708 RepID=A0A0A9CW19_ARUDO
MQAAQMHICSLGIPLGQFGAAGHAQDMCKGQNMCQPHYQFPVLDFSQFISHHKTLAGYEKKKYTDY